MELYAIRKGHRLTSVALTLCFISIIVTCVDAVPWRYYSVSDECDWIGSGLENQGREIIQPVYLRCREGMIEWQYPRGALRVILRMGQTSKEFRVCLKVDSFFSEVTLYREHHHSLKHLYGISEDNQGKKDQICFRSSGGHVVLYLEARGTQSSLKKEVFRLIYDLEPMKKGYSDCSPCTEKELLYLFCTSDFVAQGFISSLNQNEENQQTELTIHSHKVLRDSEPKVFKHKIINEKNYTFHIGTVNRPLHCGTKVGSGEFLFIGRWRLGVPYLSCAPRLNEWEKIKQEAIKSDNFDCVLQ